MARGRPQKYVEGSKKLGLRVSAHVDRWMDAVAQEVGEPKTTLMERALELYLSLRSPSSRPAGYELSEETRALLAELKADESEKPDPK